MPDLQPAGHCRWSARARSRVRAGSMVGMGWLWGGHAAAALLTQPGPCGPVLPVLTPGEKSQRGESLVALGEVPPPADTAKQP